MVRAGCWRLVVGGLLASLAVAAWCDCFRSARAADAGSKASQANDVKTVADAKASQASAAKTGYHPNILPASEEAQRQIATFRIPAGMKVTLAAAEPDVANPVCFCFDEQGRLFVAETFRQQKGVEDNRNHLDWLNDDLAAKTVEDRLAMFKKFLGADVNKYAIEHDRIRLLEDRDGDGKFEHSTVFADGFNDVLDGTGAGLLARNGDLYYTCIPSVWRLHEENKSGQADKREVLQRGYGVHVAFRGHDMHGLIIGPDGKLYFSIGDRGLNVQQGKNHLVNVESGSILRCNLDGSDLEIVATGVRNPQELAFDDYGNLFSCDNNSDSGDQARWVYLVEGGDSGWRTAYQYLADRGPFNREKIWHPYFAGQAAYIVPPIANLSDGPSGLACYPGVGMAEKYNGTFFLADFRGGAANSGIRNIKVKPKGAGFELVSNDKFWWSILATDVGFGPDCNLYVSDWVEGWEGSGKGRIYRMVDPAGTAKPQAALVAEVKKLLAGDWKKCSIDELVALLKHADRRVRQEAQFELAARKAVNELTDVALHSEHQLARIHSIWALGQIVRADPKAADGYVRLLKLFGDSDGEIRAQMAKTLGVINSLDCDSELIGMLKDDDDRAKFFAAMALGKRNRVEAVKPLLAMLETNNDADPFLRHAGVMGLYGSIQADELLERAMPMAKPVRLGAVLVLRRMKDAGVAKFLSDEEPQIVLEAARAIYDMPIADAMPDLAATIDKPFTGTAEERDAFFRRVLAANFRVGGADRAAALSQFATSADAAITDSLRIEALEMLGDWAAPAGCDRVLNMWRPIQPRAAAEAAGALKPALAKLFTQSNAVKKAAAEVAGKLGVIEAAPALVQIVNDPKRDSALRVQSLRMLDLLNEPKIWDITDAALKDADPQMRIEARRLMIKQRAGKALAVLKEALTSGEPIERQAALSQLQDLKVAGADDVLAAAMDQLLAGKMPPEMQLDLLESVEARSTPKLKEQLAKYKQSLPQDDPLAEYRVALVGGNAEIGMPIFRENTELSCRRCHKVGHGAGGVGPELTNVALRLVDQWKADADTKGKADGQSKSDEKSKPDGKSNPLTLPSPRGEGSAAAGSKLTDAELDRRLREYLLESIVLPSKVIAKGYETIVVVTDDGLTKSGVSQGEDDKELRLMAADGKLIVIPKSKIEERSTGLSAMPADLVKHMTKRQLRDLIEFLASLKGQYAEPELPEGAPAAK
ncbi:MAG TPA: PVC-type heme-binding CxxCH protein [Pirellulales bacterium]